MAENRRYGHRHGIFPLGQARQARYVFIVYPVDILSLQRPRCRKEPQSGDAPFPRVLLTNLVHVQTRDNAIVNRLNKTKVEKEVDHEMERQERLRQEGRKKKAGAIERVCSALIRDFLQIPRVRQDVRYSKRLALAPFTQRKGTS